MQGATDDMGDTSIRVSDELADELYDRKERGESYEDVVWRLIERADAAESTSDSEAPQPREEPPEPNTTRDTRETTEASPEQDPDDDLRERMVEELANHYVPGRLDSVEEKRREVLRWAWDYLRAQDEPLQTREWGGAVQAEFGDDPDFKYAGEARWEGYQFWDNCGNEVLPDLPGVVKGGDGWRIDEVEVDE